MLAKAHATKGRVWVVAAAAWAVEREGRRRPCGSGFFACSVISFRLSLVTLAA